MLFMRYFNPRSREGSDPTAVFLLHFPSISIHAPARGATAGITATQNLSQDFNPRSREGSDTVCSPFVISSQYFNPRSREGSDLPSWCIWSMASIISIHAPARGATGDAKDIWLAVRNFNPRSREGSDIQPTRNKRETADKFQSTLPRGERHHSVAFSVFLLPFQSTLPRGERPFSGSDSILCGNISIHAPARGATKEKSAPARISSFQSTLPRGERLVKPCCLKYPFNFNPRSREGSDAEKRRGNCMAKVNFNPRSREGSDGMTAGYGMQAAISIHAPARGATNDTAETCSRQSISIHAPARGATSIVSGTFSLL